jgi:transcriptional regulator GlxA family with amidase domain
MIRPLIALLTTQTYIVALVFTDSGHLRTTLVVTPALTYAKSNLKNPLTLDELAEAARLSSRQFSRAFREETGQTPAKAVERLRVEAARLMLEEGRHTVETVAYEIGFGDRERMRRAFLRNFGLPPQAVRRTAQI